MEMHLDRQNWWFSF